MLMLIRTSSAHSNERTNEGSKFSVGKHNESKLYVYALYEYEYTGEGQQNMRLGWQVSYGCSNNFINIYHKHKIILIKLS